MPEYGGVPAHWFAYSGAIRRRNEPGPTDWQSLPDLPTAMNHIELFIPRPD
jgi:hypothetical protein